MINDNDHVCYKNKNNEINSVDKNKNNIKSNDVENEKKKIDFANKAKENLNEKKKANFMFF